jgi:hypothetical protein
MSRDYGIIDQGDVLKANDIFASERQTTQIIGTILSGENLKRGCVLGKVTASGKYVAHDDGASDGSEVIAAILAEDTDATSGDEPAPIYLAGDFLLSALTAAVGVTLSAGAYNNDHIIIREEV